MKKPIFYAFLAIFVIFVIPVFNLGTFTITEVNAEKLKVPDIEEGDISLVLDSLLDNLTVAIADPPAAQLASLSESNDQQPRVYNLGKVIVRSSTFAYDIRGFDNSISVDSIPVLHYSQPEFSQAYFTVSEYAGTYNLATLLNPSFQSNIRAKITAPEYLQALAALEGTNDTAEATGFNAEFTESYALNDLEADTEVISNASQLIDYVAVEPIYQSLANFTESNENGDDFLGDLDSKDKQRKKNVISGFDNVEAGVFEILKAIIAANYSTVGDQIDPSRVTVLEYDLHNANQTAYLKDNFVKRVRAVVNNEVFEAETANTIKIFGFKVFTYKGIMKVNAGLFDGIGSIFGKVINVGKTIVSAPFKAAADIASGASKLISAPIKAVTSTISKGLDFGKSLIHKALSAPVEIAKTVGGVASKFVGTAGSVVSSVVSTGGNLVTKGLTAVTGFGKGIGNFILILLLGLGSIALAGFFIYWFYLRPKGASPA